MPTVYITAPPDAADEIARTLVEERLAACVNRIDCESTYRWDGAIHEDEEEILLAKTTEAAYPNLVDRVEAIHPYDVPCIERFDETGILDAFASWRNASVGPSDA
ncbi:divalent-cation tolerance protein CutA [Natranaeroarchaeum aerophilus]|uniref:Divalent-cation tolerance protein CutA n=1 Tax=Natranaeroarchaeum aerophilus TaxID=2917711 RepID=A0AAE3FQC7_9EURY|nr:divalent-cation tolerance protein CutA [Natranaeroarchaeum aerophilus]MCL9813339.1 divalent-cation tolerance protein CutA [Natranaeroarchaeum aerophilus]